MKLKKKKKKKKKAKLFRLGLLEAGKQDNLQSSHDSYFIQVCTDHFHRHYFKGKRIIIKGRQGRLIIQQAKGF